MAEKKAKKRTPRAQPYGLAFLVAFNLILSFYPLTRLLGGNPTLLDGPLSPDFKWLCLIFAGVALMHVAIERKRKSPRFSLLWHLAVVLGLFWQPLTAILHRQTFAMLAAFCAFVLAVLAFCHRWSRNAGAQRALRAGLLMLGVLALAQLGLSGGRALLTFRATESVRDDREKNARSFAHPNVYVLVFDTMSHRDYFLKHVDGSRGSKDAFGEFGAAMAALGYDELGGSWSNYGRTRPSMPSFFHLDYVEPEYPLLNATDGYFGFLKSDFFTFAREQGFRLVAREWNGSCPRELDECYPTESNLVLTSSILAQTPLLDILQKIEKHVFSRVSSNVLRDFTATLSTVKLIETDRFIKYVRTHPIKRDRRPRFVYAHFEAAHPINYYDADCRAETITPFRDSSGDVFNPAFSLGRYAQEYRCFLKRMTAVATAIAKHDPTAWVVVTADHGVGPQEYGSTSPEPWDAKRVESTFHILTLLRLPNECVATIKSAPAITLVNVARELANCIAGRRTYKRLPDKLETLGFTLKSNLKLRY